MASPLAVLDPDEDGREEVDIIRNRKIKVKFDLQKSCQEEEYMQLPPFLIAALLNNIAVSVVADSSSSSTDGVVIVDEGGKKGKKQKMSKEELHEVDLLRNRLRPATMALYCPTLFWNIALLMPTEVDFIKYVKLSCPTIKNWDALDHRVRVKSKKALANEVVAEEIEEDDAACGSREEEGEEEEGEKNGTEDHENGQTDAEIQGRSRALFLSKVEKRRTTAKENSISMDLEEEVHTENLRAEEGAAAAEEENEGEEVEEGEEEEEDTGLVNYAAGCTICTSTEKQVYLPHPVLHVRVCEQCLATLAASSSSSSSSFSSSSSSSSPSSSKSPATTTGLAIEKDEDGYDCACTWCLGDGGGDFAVHQQEKEEGEEEGRGEGEEGEGHAGAEEDEEDKGVGGQNALVMCSDCTRVFCRECLFLNLGEEYLGVVDGLDDWQCLVCDAGALKLANLLID